LGEKGKKGKRSLRTKKKEGGGEEPQQEVAQAWSLENEKRKDLRNFVGGEGGPDGGFVLFVRGKGKKEGGDRSPPWVGGGGQGSSKGHCAGSCILQRKKKEGESVFEQRGGKKGKEKGVLLFETTSDTLLITMSRALGGEKREKKKGVGSLLAGCLGRGGNANSMGKRTAPLF